MFSMLSFDDAGPGIEFNAFFDSVYFSLVSPQEETAVPLLRMERRVHIEDKETNESMN